MTAEGEKSRGVECSEKSYDDDNAASEFDTLTMGEEEEEEVMLGSNFQPSDKS